MDAFDWLRLAVLTLTVSHLCLAFGVIGLRSQLRAHLNDNKKEDK